MVGQWWPSAPNFLYRWNFLVTKSCSFDWVFADVLLLLHSTMTLKWSLVTFSILVTKFKCQQFVPPTSVTDIGVAVQKFEVKTYGRRGQDHLWSNVKWHFHRQHLKLFPICHWFHRRQSTHRRSYHSSVHPGNHHEGILLLIFLSVLLCYQSPKVKLVRFYKSFICR